MGGSRKNADWRLKASLERGKMTRRLYALEGLRQMIKGGDMPKKAIVNKVSDQGGGNG